MNKAVKVLIALLCLPMLGQGLVTVFNPMAMVDTYGVIPDGSHGLNTMRGAIGGLPVAMVLLILIGAWRHDTTWFLAVALVATTVAFCRLIGFGLDGVQAVDLLPFTMELVFAGLLVAAHQKFPFKQIRRGQA
jgi:hypothetical protein